MKFGQLLEDNTKNLFLEKSCARYVEETSARHFFFLKKDDISLDQQSTVSYSLFLLYVHIED